MLKGLRTRLLFSYVLILVVTLAVIGLALVLFLQVRPTLTETISLQLFNRLQQLDIAQNQRREPIQASGPNIAQRLVLARFDKQNKVRVLMVTSGGKVSFDSRRMINEGTILDYESSSYTPDLLSNIEIHAIRGVLRNPDGTSWLFVAEPPNPSSPEALRFLVAYKEPRLLTLAETLQYYGPDILIPLFEAGLVGLVVAVVMSLLIARSVAKPLQEVAKAAEAVSRGDLKQRVPVRGPKEIKTVAEAFNQMSEQVGITQAAQRDFLANVTHDLRTPLTSIQGFSQAIIDGVASNPQAAQRAARIIYEEAGRLNRMVQELLDLARIEAGRLSMTRHSIDLTEVLSTVGENLTQKAQDKGLLLEINVPPLPPIGGDHDRLVQVYTNLVDNAIKHTPEGGKITIRAEQSENGALAQVIDTGEGIPASDLPRIFDRFYQVDKSRQREKRDGVGLGLAITKGIVDAHDGQLWVESQEGVGTTFSTWFPALSHDSTTVIARRRNSLFKTPAPRPIDRQRVPAQDKP